MKIKTLLITIFTCVVNCLYSQTIPPEMAGKVAKNFFMERAMVIDSTLKNRALMPELAYMVTSNTDSLYYVFNIGSTTGWIIVSAQLFTVPVLAYSFSGSFDTLSANRPPAMNAWLVSYQKQLEYGIKENNIPNKDIIEQWDYYIKYDDNIDQHKDILSVSPLLLTTWNQGSGWNAYCPLDAAGPGG
ncbi:MAG TPA: Spi family protease inhibitor, partial [Bacteroidales bacterium]|nr:Spi family protease inhibitor [Bacteroidales bacterium]